MLSIASRILFPFKLPRVSLSVSALPILVKQSVLLRQDTVSGNFLLDSYNLLTIHTTGVKYNQKLVERVLHLSKVRVSVQIVEEWKRKPKEIFKYP